jgi:hypothetical protein
MPFGNYTIQLRYLMVSNLVLIYKPLGPLRILYELTTPEIEADVSLIDPSSSVDLTLPVAQWSLH